MKDLFLLSILIIFTFELKSRSGEYYQCINPYKTVESASDCNSIEIPVSEGYKCCMMQITFKGNETRNCFALETNYTTSRETLEEYISQQGLDAFFIKQGGKVEIECGDNFTVTENYVKFSDEFFNCYNGNKNGAQNENDCKNYDIPENETCKCCYVEISRINGSGIIQNDKRCYIISNLYFTKEKNLRDFIIDQSKIKNLTDVNDTNVTIHCKNYDTFYFISNKDEILEQPKTYISTIPKYSSISTTYINNENSEKIQTDISVNKELSSSDNENTDFIDKELNSSDNENIDYIDNGRTTKKKSSKTWLIILLIIIIFIVVIGIVIFVIYKIKSKNNNLSKDKDNSENENQISK